LLVMISDRHAYDGSGASESADRVSVRGEERKPSLIQMISDRHVYGASRASEVFTGSAGKCLY